MLNAIGERLERERKDLLDLSLRNPLLNYVKRAKTIEIVGESTAELYRILVESRKAMTLIPAADPVKSDETPSKNGTSDDRSLEIHNGADVSSDKNQNNPLNPEGRSDLENGSNSPIDRDSADKRREKSVDTLKDLKLQTNISADTLQKKLLDVYLFARLAQEEQGVNTLFLVLGMLTWRETEASDRDKPRRAPLILLPVALERSSARDRFRLRHEGDDPEFNLSLAEKLKADFSVDLPRFGDDGDEADFDPVKYLDAVAAAIAGKQGWGVERDSAVIGFFSFGKFLMFRDLAEENWPDGMKPSEHPLMRALLIDGFEQTIPAIGDDESIDKHSSVAALRMIVDADSSQTLAVLDASMGRHFVIQGPPGTGKSQTITNLIAESIGRGKSVLFVAEKMAALEVVKRRLDAAGLGAACLELHSHKMKKSDVIAELKRTIELDAPRVLDREGKFDRWLELRDALNAYCEAINTPIAPAGITPRDACASVVRLKAELNAVDPDPPIVDPGQIASWTRVEFEKRYELIRSLADRIRGAGSLADHPFQGSRKSSLTPVEFDKPARLSRSGLDALAALRTAANALADALSLPTAKSPREAAALVAAERYAGRADQFRGFDLRSSLWINKRKDIKKLIDTGLAVAADLARHETALKPEAWDADINQEYENLKYYESRWWRFLSKTYRSTIARLRTLCRGSLPGSIADRIDLARAIIESKPRRKMIERAAPTGSRLFGPLWNGERSDWKAIALANDRIARLKEEIASNQIPPEILDLLASNRKIQVDPAILDSARRSLADHAAKIAEIVSFLELDETKIPRTVDSDAVEKLVDRSFDEQEKILKQFRDRAEELKTLIDFNQIADSCRVAGLANWVDLAESWPVAASGLPVLFDLKRNEAVLDASFRERTAIARFVGEEHDKRIEAFQQIDRELPRIVRSVLAREHWNALPRHDAGGQLGVLRREFQKKTRHLPVRKLVEKAGLAVRAIKPVFMMSPLSIAGFLPPGVLDFDLVVFDEASQVRPVDALGALLRGKQAIVVGDTKQLPPTNFFDKMVQGDDPDDDEESTRDVESVLSQFLAKGAPQRMLRWHYRSRHESLIAVSNQEFYENKLVVFPSPDKARRVSGLALVKLEHSIYDRGVTRTNPVEADAAARAVLDHARAWLAAPPERRLSLGVAAFSVAQTEAILDRLEELRRADPSCEEFFNEKSTEPFFVKNLENVQGDERDVIFISIGYGRGKDGSIAMNFGPLNGEGGERRLNVLITRARIRCVVFTNLASTDLDRATAKGVRALRSFLAYAESGTLDGRDSTAIELAAILEKDVAESLKARGYQTIAQVGSGAFRVDLAVVDPNRPGRYLLAIVCDGSSYHDARSARDRDRLRGQVLEGLGWPITRVWSVDWFRDPQAQIERLVAAIDAARARADELDRALAEGEAEFKKNEENEAEAKDEEVRAETESDDSGIEDEPDPNGEASIDDEPVQAFSGEDEPSDCRYYQIAELTIHPDSKNLHLVPVSMIARWVASVVEVESPVARSEAMRRIADAAGVKRIGARIEEAIDRGIEYAAGRGMIARAGDFLSVVGSTAIVPRDRSKLPAAMRKFELVAPSEIEAAIVAVVERSYGIAAAEIATHVNKSLGFARLTDENRAKIDAIVASLVAAGRLDKIGENIQKN